MRLLGISCLVRKHILTPDADIETEEILVVFTFRTKMQLNLFLGIGIMRIGNAKNLGTKCFFVPVHVNRLTGFLKFYLFRKEQITIYNFMWHMFEENV
jgi:hypothetical protein